MHVLCTIFPKNCSVYDTMWKSMVESNKLQMTIWSMRHACWIRNATNRHLEYVTFIAFPLERWLHERVVLLRYRHIVCLVRKPFRNLHLYPSVLYFEEKSDPRFEPGPPKWAATVGSMFVPQYILFIQSNPSLYMGHLEI
jgi:hypothetical protein